jgi:hypothetical protein
VLSELYKQRQVVTVLKSVAQNLKEFLVCCLFFT